MSRIDARHPHLVARTEAELIAAIQNADEAGVPVHLIRAGAIAPQDATGQVIEVATTGVTVNEDGCSIDSLVYCGAVTATVAAGEDWDDFVARAVANEWVGIEALAGQEGTVGEVVARNATAFGQSVADTVAGVHTWDRQTQGRRYLAWADCEFTPDGSRLSAEQRADGSPRYVPLQVSFLFRQGDITAPIRDDALAAFLGVGHWDRVPLDVVRERVLTRRRS